MAQYSLLRRLMITSSRKRERSPACPPPTLTFIHRLSFHNAFIVILRTSQYFIKHATAHHCRNISSAWHVLYGRAFGFLWYTYMSVKLTGDLAFPIFIILYVVFGLAHMGNINGSTVRWWQPRVHSSSQPLG